MVEPYLYPFMGSRAKVRGRAEPYGPCVVKACNAFSAIPDKAMMCPRAHLQPMLRGFLDDMHLHTENGLFDVWWLEKIRERTLARFGVSVLKVRHPALPYCLLRSISVPLPPLLTLGPSLVQVDADEMPLVVARPPCFCNARVAGRDAPWCLRSRTSDCIPPLNSTIVFSLTGRHWRQKFGQCHSPN